MPPTEKQEEIQQIAETFFAEKLDWVSFYREVFGLHGIVRKAFPSRETRNEFERTDTYRDIQRMLTRLRRQGPVAADPEEPTKMITVRLPKSLHEALREEAHERRTTMNKLCISKLLQLIDDQQVPADA